MIIWLILSIVMPFLYADEYIRPLDRNKCPISEDIVFTLAEYTKASYVEYRLYTKRNPENFQIIKTPEDILQSNYNQNAKTIFLVHGYRSSPDSLWAVYMKSVILQQYDYNVIIVNWKKGAAEFYAPYAIANAYATGKEIAKMITLLVEITNTTVDQFHLIGFSLGGQVLGFAGKNLKNKVARITSLDPAGPCFILFSSKHRIHHTDAKFVDVIVTNAGGYGLAKPVGHVYFSVNGGRTQKTCGASIVSQIETGITDQLVLDSCSHGKAPKYFTESMFRQQCAMVGYSCDSHYSFMQGKCADCGNDGEKCTLMGINADKYIPYIKNETERFYIETNFESPFCLFHLQVTVKISNNENSMPQQGKLSATFEGNDMHALKHLKEVPQELEPGHSYTYLITNSFDFDPSKSIKFEWFRTSTIFSNYTNLFVECIKVVKMNNLLRNRSKVTSWFRSQYDSVQPGEKITFTQSTVICE